MFFKFKKKKTIKIIMMFSLLFLLIFTFFSCSSVIFETAQFRTTEESNVSHDESEVKIDYYLNSKSTMFGFIQKSIMNAVESDEIVKYENLKNLPYVKALEKCFEVPNLVWGIDCETTYNRYNQQGMYTYSESRFKQNYYRNEFYGDSQNSNADYEKLVEWDDMDGSTVFPFKNLVEVLAKSKEKRISVITTDLYEENGEYKSFVALYATAFENGMSGSLFCIESNFIGKLYNFSNLKQGQSIDIRTDNVKSHFFILIVGPTQQVHDFSAALAVKLKQENMNYEYTDFISLSSDLKGFANYDMVHVANPVNEVKMTDLEEYSFSTVNIKQFNGGNSMIRTKEYETVQSASDKNNENESETSKINKFTVKEISDLFSFKPLGNKFMRYILCVPITERNVGTFDYVRETNDAVLSVYDSKTESFMPYEKDFSGIIDLRIERNIPELEEFSKSNYKFFQDTNLLYIIIEIKDLSALPKEYMRLEIPIKYDVEAMKDESLIPDWVIKYNAQTETELLESVDDLENNLGILKILNLKAIYQTITTEFLKSLKNSSDLVHTQPVYIINK